MVVFEIFWGKILACFNFTKLFLSMVIISVGLVITNILLNIAFTSYFGSEPLRAKLSFKCTNSFQISIPIWEWKYEVFIR